MFEKLLTKFNFYLDKKGKIIKLNRIKPDNFFSVYLLSENNKILIPGNPVFSEKLTNDYIRVIADHQTLINYEK